MKAFVPQILPQISVSQITVLHFQRPLRNFNSLLGRNKLLRFVEDNLHAGFDLYDMRQ